MNIKILYHIMPWEIDYALLTYTQLKKSSYHLSGEDNIIIESVLNLSSYIIDWDKSKLPKSFFIHKFISLQKLLGDYENHHTIFNDNRLYGHLDFQKQCINTDTDTDYYIILCPDMYFSEHLLAYMIAGAKEIKNKYFMITPQISKLWDSTWDEITNEKYLDIPYSDWKDVDIFDIRNDLKNDQNETSLIPTFNSKWAGWFDLYSKSFIEELCPIQESWTGYGPWDWYSLMLTEYVKGLGVDFQQYLLKGETIFEYSVGDLKNGGFSESYKGLMVLHDIPNQRQEFEKNMKKYLDVGIQALKNKNII